MTRVVGAGRWAAVGRAVGVPTPGEGAGRGRDDAADDVIRLVAAGRYLGRGHAVPVGRSA